MVKGRGQCIAVGSGSDLTHVWRSDLRAVAQGVSRVLLWYNVRSLTRSGEKKNIQKMCEQKEGGKAVLYIGDMQAQEGLILH